MNNKGFAITALLYGLSIIILMTVVLMMSVMQNTRKNNRTLVNTVEEELNDYGFTSFDSNIEENKDIIRTIPSEQKGYYKMEFCKKKGGTNQKVFYSGSVYLQGGEEIKIHGNQVIIDGIIVVRESFINGMGKSYDPSDSNDTLKKYPFINGQIIENSSCPEKFHMHKVSTDAPFFENDYFDNVSRITATGASKITVIYYKPNSIDKPEVRTINNTVINDLPSNNKISEIYFNYEDNSVSHKIIINKNNNNTNYYLAIDSSNDGKYKINDNFTLSRFGQKSSSEIHDGTYAISLLSKDNNTFKKNQGNVLSTSAYTPTSPPTGNDKTYGGKLVHYGSESFARPVILSNYNSENFQKWRFESLAGSKYRITEIEEYKTFEVHKQDESVGTTGPILVCGEFYWNNNVFTSSDEFKENQNQKWKIEAVGAGIYRFTTNHDLSNGPRYLYCAGTGNSNRCYITTNASDASLFQIFNVDL